VVIRLDAIIVSFICL